MVLTRTISDATPLSQLNPKKKIFETIQPGVLFFSSSSLTVKLVVTESRRVNYAGYEGGGVGQFGHEYRA